MTANENPGLLVLEAQRGRIHLRMTALPMGRDLCVTLSGGDRPHLGSVALAQPHSQVSALSLPKHREEDLARSIATQLASEFNLAVCVACGVHLDRILPTEIQDVLEMAEALTRELSAELEGMPPSKSK